MNVSVTGHPLAYSKTASYYKCNHPSSLQCLYTYVKEIFSVISYFDGNIQKCGVFSVINLDICSASRDEYNACKKGIHTNKSQNRTAVFRKWKQELAVKIQKIFTALYFCYCKGIFTANSLLVY